MTDKEARAVFRVLKAACAHANWAADYELRALNGKPPFSPWDAKEAPLIEEMRAAIIELGGFVPTFATSMAKTPKTKLTVKKGKKQ